MRRPQANSARSIGKAFEQRAKGGTQSPETLEKGTENVLERPPEEDGFGREKNFLSTRDKINFSCYSSSSQFGTFP